MWLLNQMLSRVIRQGQMIVTDHDGSVHTYGPDGAAPIRLRLTNPKAAAHIARYPQVGAGEAYMRGWLVIEPPHDVRDLVLFVTAQAKGDDEKHLKAQGTVRQFVNRVAAWKDSFNDRNSASKNADHTYNLTRRLYELFLDEDRQYTMAYYREPGLSLEQAQLDKKAHIAGKLFLQPGKSQGLKVLDIGCGWGGLAFYLHKHYGVEVLGVALAQDQIEFCKERAIELGVADQVKFELMDYRDVSGSFDRITSVGLLEHVGTRHYPDFFGHTFKLLKDDGVMFSHCCGRATGPGVTDAWTRKYIFPGAYIPALSELVAGGENAGWQVMDVEAMRFHYSHTLEEWYRRTQLHKDEIVALYDEQFYRMWEFYLCGAEQSFRNGTLVNWQLQYVKRRDAIPMTREYMHDESARLRGADVAPAWRLDPELRQAAE
jgi:cyclopropane-fatty-acyl-phospholipid synthase